MIIIIMNYYFNFYYCEGVVGDGGVLLHGRSDGGATGK